MRVTSEVQLQKAVNDHANKDSVLEVIIAANIKLSKGVVIGKDCGPLHITASKAAPVDALREPEPSAMLDGSKIKPAAPVFVINTLSPVNFTGLAIKGAKGAAAVQARQSGPLAITGCVLRDTNNTGMYADQPNGGAVACISCQQLTIVGTSFKGNSAKIGGALYGVNIAKGVVLDRSWFIENTCGSDGGSMALSSTHLRMTNCSYIKNEVGVSAK